MCIRDSACTESFTESVSSGNKEWLLSGRVDYNLGQNDKIFGRVRFDRGVQPTYTDPINSAFNNSSVQPQDEGQLNYTHIFSPTVVNNFIFSDLYYAAVFGNLNPSSALGLFPGNLEFLVDGALTPPVSYTHLDVYKRQPLKILSRSVRRIALSSRSYSATRRLSG